MYFDTTITEVQSYQIIKDEKKMLLDKIYTNEKKKRHHNINPFKH